MNQEHFNETIQELNKAVGEKEGLEQKLERIKDKIKKAKQIKEDFNTNQTSANLSQYHKQLQFNSEPAQADLTIEAPLQSVSTVQPASHNCIDSLPISQYNQHSLPRQLESAPQLSQVTSIAKSPSHAVVVPTTDQTLLAHEHRNLLQESMRYNVSHMESHEEFQKKLNFQYLPRDLKKSQNVSQVEFRPSETFAPDSHRLNEIYLQKMNVTKMEEKQQQIKANHKRIVDLEHGIVDF